MCYNVCWTAAHMMSSMQSVIFVFARVHLIEISSDTNHIIYGLSVLAKNQRKCQQSTLKWFKCGFLGLAFIFQNAEYRFRWIFIQMEQKRRKVIVAKSKSIKSCQLNKVLNNSKKNPYRRKNLTNLVKLK